MKKYLISIMALIIAPACFAANIAEGGDCSAKHSVILTPDGLDTVERSGSCAWHIDEEGTLVISGDGYIKDAMVEYNGETGEYQEGSMPPWNDYGDQIKKVKIEEGIKGIGYYNFVGLGVFDSQWEPFVDDEELDSVVENGGFAAYQQEHKIELELPQSLEIIGPYAFTYNYFMPDITIPENVERIGEGAFYSALLNSLTIPDKAVIGEGAFSDLIDPNTLEERDLSTLTVYCTGSQALCNEHLHVYYPTMTAQIRSTPSTPKRLIYTVEEAAQLVKPQGNTFSIRYK